MKPLVLWLESDEAAWAQVMARLGSKFELQRVKTVSEAQKALKARGRAVRVLVADAQHGLGFASSAGHEVPVILVSAAPRALTDEDVSSPSIAAFHAKPFDFNALELTLARLAVV